MYYSGKDRELELGHHEGYRNTLSGASLPDSNWFSTTTLPIVTYDKLSSSLLTLLFTLNPSCEDRSRISLCFPGDNSKWDVGCYAGWREPAAFVNFLLD